jgi:ribosomal protein L3
VRVDLENNVIVVRGGVAGPNGGLLVLRHTK